MIARSILHRLRTVLERDLIEQSVVQRLTKAAFAACVLWLAIWWALA